MRSFLAGLALVVAGCVVGAPPGFGSGDRWSVPIVNPLESDIVVVPVRINGAGPFLFALDPEGGSSVEASLRTELALHTTFVSTQQRRSRTGDHWPWYQTEVKSLTIGSLTVRNRVLDLHETGAYVAAGRPVRGVLGREVFSDTLIVSIDRDRGLVTIATQKHLAPPTEATAIDYDGDGVFHSYIDIAIAGRKETVYLDQTRRHTRLSKRRLDKLGLQWATGRWRLTNSLGEIWYASSAAIAPTIQIGRTSVPDVAIIPFDPAERMEQQRGGLGQDVLSRVNFITNRHERKLWLWPRGDAVATSAERLSRWGKVFDGCPTPACVSARLDGTRLVVDRDASAVDLAYEVVLQPVDTAGAPLPGAPRLQVTLPRGQSVVVDPAVDPAMAAAAGFLAVDASPFPRGCEQDPDSTARCVWAFEAP